MRTEIRTIAPGVEMTVHNTTGHDAHIIFTNKTSVLFFLCYPKGGPKYSLHPGCVFYDIVDQGLVQGIELKREPEEPGQGYANQDPDLHPPLQEKPAGWPTRKEREEGRFKKVVSHILPPPKLEGYSTFAYKFPLPKQTPGFKVSLKSAPCQHDWKHYQGFSESYDYCAKCDEKKR